jgi:ATP-dependent helicase/nuclease subunit B
VGVRLIAGRAGSGKTHWCQSRIQEALAESLIEGPRLIMLVPEQAALQMERGLLAMSPAKVLGRCEVLSFRRLAHRILNDSATAVPVILSPIGRQMALRHLIARRRRNLKELGRVADRGGVVSAIASAVVELIQECVSPEALEAEAKTALSEQDPSGGRLHDVALLYRAYLEYLGSTRVDPEGVLDLARAKLAAVDWLRGSHIWIDGFAGLSGQQVRMIVDLARQAAQVDVALLLDPGRGRLRPDGGPPDDLSLFARTERTWFALQRTLHQQGVSVEEPVLLEAAAPPRFREAALLAKLERGLFATPLKERTPQVDGPPNGQATDRRAAEGGQACAVRLLKAPTRRAEVAAAVRTIIDLTQQAEGPLRYRDVSIVVRDLEPYHELISAELQACGIPFFIDRRRPTHHHPLVQLVRAALAMDSSGSFDQAITMLLKTGLSGLADADGDALENYLLAHGLRTAESWDEPWTYPPVPERTGRKPKANAGKKEPPRPFEPMDRLRRLVRERIGDWWPAPTDKPGRPSCKTWVRRLYALLEALQVSKRLVEWCDEAVARGDLDEAEEHEQVWADLVKLLDEIVETLGDESMSGAQFRDVLESGLGEFTLGLVPATLDQVLVSSIERSRHPAVRAVFVLGFNDGMFPVRAADHGVLGDEERARLERAGVELGRTRARQLLDERMLAYVAFTRPSEFLWVSYAESDEAGKALAPSPYWPHLQAAIGEAAVEEVATEGIGSIGTASQLAANLAREMRVACEGRPLRGWPSLYKWARSATPIAGVVRAALQALAPSEKARLSPETAATIWPPPYRTSVTRLESFAACPFQHFARYGLRLAPRPLHEIAELDMGRIYHAVMEQFVNELMETGHTLREMPPAMIAESLSRLCRTVVPQYAEMLRMEQREQQAAMRRGERDLPQAVHGQKRRIGRTKLRPLATEKTFGDVPEDDLPALQLRLADSKVVTVRGVIDRVDIVQTGESALAVVFDYKRSLGRRLQLEEVFHGLALQLLAYLLVVREHGRKLAGTAVIPGAACYLPLLAGVEKVEHPEDADEEGFDPYKAYGPRGIVDFDWIDTLDPGLAEGGEPVFSARRKKDGEVSNIDSSDAVGDGRLPLLLDFVRGKMTSLAEGWLAGDIAVSPYRLGRVTPCARCDYRSVCRLEYAAREARPLARMKRSEVLDGLAGSERRRKKEGEDA